MNEEILNLTKKIDVVLDLRKLTNVKAQVCLCIDGSGSMNQYPTKLYDNGTVQKAVDRISAVAVKFDDNQELDVMVFSNDVNEAQSATPEMFGNYVQKYLLDKGLVQFGGTSYVPFIKQVVENYFSKNESVVSKMSSSIFGTLMNVFKSKPTTTPTPVHSSKSNSGFPIFVIIITDGENSDQTETYTLLKEMQDRDIYWSMIGIGTENFTFLKQLNDNFKNVEFIKFRDIEIVKDIELYKLLLSEKFSNWIKNI